MPGFVHGVRALEIPAAGFGWPTRLPRATSPEITSHKLPMVDEGLPFSATLAADRPVQFQKLFGDDTDLFEIDGPELSLPAYVIEDGKDRFVCRIRATDEIGNVTDFEVALQLVPSPIPPGGLDFSQPENSAFIR